MTRRTYYAVQSGNPQVGKGSLFYAGPGEWVAQVRDAAKFSTREAAELVAADLGGCEVVQVEG